MSHRINCLGFDLDKVISYPIADLVKTLEETKYEVVLFGASIHARFALAMLMEIGVKVDIVCDSNLSKDGKPFCGFNIVHVSKLKKGGNYIVFLCTIFTKPMLRTMNEKELSHVFSLLPLYDAIKFDSVAAKIKEIDDTKTKEDYFRHHTIYKNEYLKFYNNFNPNRLEIKSIDVVVTEACSMKCIDCSNLMQYYEKPQKAEMSDLINDVQKLSESVDWVYEFRILGGEPFMIKDLHKVIREILALGNFSKLVIYTNGTIVPKRENLECLKDERVFVDISDYGTLSRNLQKLRSALTAENIMHTTKQPVWTDSGRILPYQERSVEEHQQIFENCCTNDTITLLHGKLYRCPFSANATNLDAIPIEDNEFISVPNYSDQNELKTKLIEFYKSDKYITACCYCRGRDHQTPNVEVAIQTKEILPIPQQTYAAHT